MSAADSVSCSVVLEIDRRLHACVALGAEIGLFFLSTTDKTKTTAEKTKKHVLSEQSTVGHRCRNGVTHRTAVPVACIPHVRYEQAGQRRRSFTNEATTIVPCFRVFILSLLAPVYTHTFGISRGFTQELLIV